MHVSAMITQQELKELVKYNPKTGVFTWLRSAPNRRAGSRADHNGSNGHPVITIKGKQQQAARMAWLYIHGTIPDGRVRFVNGNYRDCREVNLRLALNKQQHYRLFNERNPGAMRQFNLRKKYGIELADYQKMYVAQGGVCAACEQPETVMRSGQSRWLCVDHCHTTGDIRGLLCVGCNTAVGYSKDDPVRLRKQADYLERHIAKQSQLPASNVIRLRGP